jgi:hypothetical protein
LHKPLIPVYYMLPTHSSESSTPTSAVITSSSSSSTTRSASVAHSTSYVDAASNRQSQQQQQQQHQRCPSYHAKQWPAKQWHSLLPSERYAKRRYSTVVRPLTISTPSTSAARAVIRLRCRRSQLQRSYHHRAHHRV